MPAKKNTLTDAERRRRLIETGREIEVEQSRKAFDRAFAKVVSKPASKRNQPSK
ncbi:MAG: hypothetical protein ACHQK9_01500 [Reyranellales bacterium]